MAESPTRWQLIRDLLVFQLKLVADALRDLVLSPVSLVAGAIDLLGGGERSSRYFYDVLRMTDGSSSTNSLRRMACVCSMPPSPASWF